MYYDYEPEYFEPGILDELLAEYQEKAKEALLDSVKTELKSIHDENERLRKENEELRKNERNIRNKESELKSKEKDLERRFYYSKFSELLTPFTESLITYCVATDYRKEEKCNKCNEDRQVAYTSEDGDVIFKSCKCSNLVSKYVPEEAELLKLNLFKDDRERKFIIKPIFESKREYDESYSTLKLQKIIDKFDESEVSKINKYECVFTSKEECQKYCDYLNNKKKDD